MINIQPACFFQTANTPSPPGGDPYFENVVFYLKGIGTNGDTTFTDYSPLGVTVTGRGIGTPTISNTQAKFGTTSILFGADSSSYVSANNANLALGTENFTIEMWAYKETPTGNDGAMAIGTSATAFGQQVASFYNGTLYTFGNVNTATSFPLNQWNHIAIVREGTGTGQLKTYLNGSLIHTKTDATNVASTFYNVGTYASTALCWTGWLDRVRVTKGVARYTANFNPETDTYLT